MTTRRLEPVVLSGETAAASAAAHTPYRIDVRFLGGLTSSQMTAFNLAAARWGRVIVNNQPGVRVGSETIDGLTISARGATIDGAGKVLGRAGPTVLRPGSMIPAQGIMEFDTADLLQMELEKTLLDVITHEMGHVLGIGTIWDRLGLLKGSGGPNPTFVGGSAVQELHVLIGHGAMKPVPVENTGGPGTADGHWRETVFGNELMTGFVGDSGNSLSRMTAASLQDLGYTVDMSAAEPYALPSGLELAIMGVGAERPHRYQCAAVGSGSVPEPIVLDPTTLVSAKHA